MDVLAIEKPEVTGNFKIFAEYVMTAGGSIKTSKLASHLLILPIHFNNLGKISLSQRDLEVLTGGKKIFDSVGDYIGIYLTVICANAAVASFFNFIHTGDFNEADEALINGADALVGVTDVLGLMAKHRVLLLGSKLLWKISVVGIVADMSADIFNLQSQCKKLFQGLNYERKKLAVLTMVQRSVSLIGNTAGLSLLLTTAPLVSLIVIYVLTITSLSMAVYNHFYEQKMTPVDVAKQIKIA